LAQSSGLGGGGGGSGKSVEGLTICLSAEDTLSYTEGPIAFVRTGINPLLRGHRDGNKHHCGSYATMFARLGPRTGGFAW